MQVLLFMSQLQLSALLHLGIKEYKAAKKKGKILNITASMASHIEFLETGFVSFLGRGH